MLRRDLYFRMNSHIVRFLESQKKSPSGLKNGVAGSAELDDGCDATAVLLKKGELPRCRCVLAVALYFVSVCGLMDQNTFEVSL